MEHKPPFPARAYPNAHILTPRKAGMSHGTLGPAFLSIPPFMAQREDGCHGNGAQTAGEGV